MNHAEHNARLAASGLRYRTRDCVIALTSIAASLGSLLRGPYWFQRHMDDLTPTSELEAVNAILATISEAPLNTLEGVLESDAALAKLKLRQASRALQLEGWSFNYEPDYTLNQNIEGKVAVPTNALVVHFDGSTNYVPRGRFVYDTDTKSYIIGQDLVANITFFLPFDELPEHARMLIYLKAGKSFQDQQLGEAVLRRFSETDIRDANASFMNIESTLLNLNLANKAPSVQRIRRFRNVN